MQELKRLSPSGVDPTEKQIQKHILAANEVAREAIQQGQHPFGAILVDADNQTVLMSQGNIDTVNHAESTLARLAAEKYSPEHLWQCTLYSTVEPCVMCAGTFTVLMTTPAYLMGPASGCGMNLVMVSELL